MTSESNRRGFSAMRRSFLRAGSLAGAAILTGSHLSGGSAAGGKDPAKLDAALEKVFGLVERMSQRYTNGG